MKTVMSKVLRPVAELAIGTAIATSRERLLRTVLRRVADGCERLWTVAEGCAPSSEHNLNPQTPRVKQEPLLRIRENSKTHGRLWMVVWHRCRANWTWYIELRESSLTDVLWSVHVWKISANSSMVLSQESLDPFMFWSWFKTTDLPTFPNLRLESTVSRIIRITQKYSGLEQSSPTSLSPGSLLIAATKPQVFIIYWVLHMQAMH